MVSESVCTNSSLLTDNIKSFKSKRYNLSFLSRIAFCELIHREMAELASETMTCSEERGIEAIDLIDYTILIGTITA